MADARGMSAEWWAAESARQTRLHIRAQQRIVALEARLRVSDGMVKRAEEKFWEPVRVEVFGGETCVTHRSDMRAALEAALNGEGR